MKLLVSQAVPRPDGGSRPCPDEARPALRLIQGGRARPRRSVLGSPTPAVPATPARSPADPRPGTEELPIYLRPLPAWVPRLW